MPMAGSQRADRRMTIRINPCLDSRSAARRRPARLLPFRRQQAPDSPRTRERPGDPARRGNPAGAPNNNRTTCRPARNRRVRRHAGNDRSGAGTGYVTETRASSADDRHNPDVRRRTAWIRSGSRQLFAWRHEPASRDGADGRAIVLCQPLGHEQVHAHRSVRRLADELARAGHSVLRFDYTGTGDSEGEQPADGLAGDWLEDVRAVVRFQQAASGKVVDLVGIRSGALPAACSAAAAGGALVLWDPVATGKRFVRELKANSRLAYFRSDPTLLQAAGTAWTPGMLEALAALDVGKALEGFTQPVLLVTRREQPDTRLARSLDDSGVAVHSQPADGLEDMLVEPHHTKIPETAIAAVVAWFAGLPPAAASPVTPEEPAGEATYGSGPDAIVEEPLDIGESHMFGLYCRPAGMPAGQGPVVLFGNAGSVYHVGPSRLYVTLARRLARAGIPSVRYDLANIGDGMTYEHVEANIPYPSDAVQRITEVLEFVRDGLGHRQAVLTGFCSGATQAFHAALAQREDSALRDVIMVNPKVFYGEHAGQQDDNLVMRRSSYYARAMRDPQRWRRLLSGDIDYRKLAQFLRGRLRLLGKGIARACRRLLLRDSGTRLGNDLTRFVDSGHGLAFFFSTRDPGHRVLLESSGGVAKRLIESGRVQVTKIEDGDHTLIQKRCRDDFSERFVAQLIARHGRGG